MEDDRDDDTIEDASLEEIFNTRWDEVQTIPTLEDRRTPTAIERDNDWWSRTYGTAPPWQQTPSSD
jgi:hypothetical protein